MLKMMACGQLRSSRCSISVSGTTSPSGPSKFIPISLQGPTLVFRGHSDLNVVKADRDLLEVGDSNKDDDEDAVMMMMLSSRKVGCSEDLMRKTG